jgi:phosphohistidine phosphatase
MDMFLVRHGEAMPATKDPQRPLSPEGAEVVGKMAVWARKAGVRVEQIRHSGKLRAEETAHIFGKHLNPARGIVAVPGLGPNDDEVFVAGTAHTELVGTMLVGHLPFLDRLVGQLVAGDPAVSVVRFCSAAVVCLHNEEGRWFVHWVMTPDLLK